ncbi:MAG: hypothetical protein AB7R55_07945 [Gemmatimonadales bacterium]
MSRSSHAPLRRCSVGAALLAAACATEGGSPTGVALPARFEADRIFVDLPVAGRDDTLRLYTDTGGGLFVLGRAADRIGLADSAGITLSALAPDFPDPRGAENGRVPLLRPERVPFDDLDGMLGQAWFADRVWSFDYPGQALRLHPDGLPAETLGARAELWFQRDSTGRRTLAFPRIQVAVDGEILDLLLDTGATLSLTESALATLADGRPAVRATSFITSGVLAGWRRRHPDWRVVPDADRSVPGMAMIEVPEVTIAGHAVGPVWFTERPDRNFREFMAQWMDRPVEGAVGGNAFRFFVMTVDYPGAVAYFAPATAP